MPADTSPAPPPGQTAARLRLDTLVRLRWLAIAGQSAAIVAVHVGLGFTLPVGASFMVIAASAILNICLRIFYPVSERLDSNRAAMLLAFDVMQLAVLLYLTGGLQNPFAILFLAPVLISATTLPPVPTMLLGFLAIGCATFLAFFQLPLPWESGVIEQLPFLYVLGVWVAIAMSVAFIGVYAWRVAEEARQLSQALAATELVLAREQHLSALDGLAAAAAHELGTPLATIYLVVKELDRATPADNIAKDDITLLRTQVERCREILRTLTSLDDDGAPFARLPVTHLLEEVAAPQRAFDVEVDIVKGDCEPPEPTLTRNPGILYGLGNLLDNAVDFARSRVVLGVSWSEDQVSLSITDDGFGFSADILAHLGEPYVTTRGVRSGEGDSATGLGLGVFIAKTLLERSGATVTFQNVAAPETGAQIRIIWPRSHFEAHRTGRNMGYLL
ncbi:ATPase [Agaricicola taiwanensis]|uniref:histidine kinase n=1 Tax=Agaricicola taiwanensis TaxID=591372 RepID=A0A8J2VM51_9RHOB|nr:ActS/PrrB/RegB family redox-sensitive histidine kinase [Agaricicola taiwanensis]GGE29651.1 ATPase [Agaricicola taiwanensis]